MLGPILLGPGFEFMYLAALILIILWIARGLLDIIEPARGPTGGYIMFISGASGRLSYFSL